MHREAESHEEEDFGARVARPAEFPIRALAHAIDLVFETMLALGAGMVTGIALATLAAMGVLAPGWQAKLGGVSAVGLALGLIGPILYHTVSEWLGGASLGKWLCGLRVYTPELSPDGTFLLALRPCTARGAFIRSLAFLVDAMFFGAVAYLTMRDSTTQARLGDRWGRTIVVHARSIRGAHASSPALGVFASVVVYATCVALQLTIKVL